MARRHTLASQLVKNLVLPGLGSKHPLCDPARLQPVPETLTSAVMSLTRCPGGGPRSQEIRYWAWLVFRVDLSRVRS